MSTGAVYRIQDAVTAAPAGATIHVCAGTYKKQVMITRAVTISADTGSILQPVGALPNATSFNMAAPTTITALLLVINARNVSIDDLTMDGSSSQPVGCGVDYMSVMYQNAGGTLTNMAVRNIKLAAGPRESSIAI